MIRQAMEEYRKLPMLEKIALMVKSGLLTEELADRARKKLAEIAAAEAAATSAGPPAEGGPRGVEDLASVPQAG